MNTIRSAALPLLHRTGTSPCVLSIHCSDEKADLFAHPCTVLEMKSSVPSPLLQRVFSSPQPRDWETALSQFPAAASRIHARAECILRGLPEVIIAANYAARSGYQARTL